MNLYFGSVLSSISTLLVISIFVYIGVTVARQKKIKYWGRKIATLALWGLLVCFFVAFRDGYHLSVQATMNSDVLPGLFTLDSIQSTLCCLCGALIAFCSLSPIFIKKQRYRKVMFFILSAAIIFKTLVIEISRVLA